MDCCRSINFHLLETNTNEILSNRVLCHYRNSLPMFRRIQNIFHCVCFVSQKFNLKILSSDKIYQINIFRVVGRGPLELLYIPKFSSLPTEDFFRNSREFCREVNTGRESLQCLNNQCCYIYDIIRNKSSTLMMIKLKICPRVFLEYLSVHHLITN